MRAEQPPVAFPPVDDGADPRLAVFDALPDVAALVDDLGRITHVNGAWRTFATLNGGTDERVGIGVDYLAACRVGAAGGDGDASAVAAGLDGVLAGRLRAFEHRYPCPSPIEERWFVARITPLPDRAGALISHLDVTASKLAEDRLRYRASHDPLTGLANREEVLAHLRRAIARLGRTGAPIAVLFLDLDHFKPINDLYGHAIGDRLLVQVAHRLGRQLRATDIVGRVGGDEFLAVCDAGDAGSVVGRLRNAIASPFQFGTDSVRIDVSIGVAIADRAMPGDAEETARGLVAEADRSMYEDKRRRGTASNSLG